METKVVNGSFADLFKPLKPVGAEPDKATESAANSATGQPATPGAVPPGSEASAKGTVTAEQAISGLEHTTISTISAPGAPGQPTGQAGTGSASVSLGGMMQGEWAVNIMDALLPAAIVAAFHYMGMKLRKSELQLTASEKATLSPIMQKCLDSVLLNFNNPWNALIITIAAIYGGKVMEKGLVAFIDNKQEKQQDEALKAKMEAADKAANPAKYDYANQSATDIMSGNVVTPGSELPYSEEDIRRRMKEGKCGRAKAIAWLNKRYNVQ